MKLLLKRWSLIALLLGVGLALLLGGGGSQAQEEEATPLVAGDIVDPQDQPVEGAEVTLLTGPQDTVVAETTTQANGHYVLSAPEDVPNTLAVRIERPHFQVVTLELDAEAIADLRSDGSVAMPTTTLARRITPAFWIATLIFVVMLVLIATGILHNTLAALLGASLVFAISYLGYPLVEDLYIFEFERALEYIDWNVIFLIMGMMIVIAVVERTGIFQWLAYMAYRMSGGRLWLLLPILMVITGVASALLDNVTTMLLMTPITIQIALSLGINPLSLLIPEVMASNVVGISTLIGTPTNILIGSFASISFNDFLINLTPGVILAMVGLTIYSIFTYRKQILEKGSDDISPLLLEKLEERAQITQPANLRKAGLVGAAMILLFVFGERIHLLPAVTAIMGATALLVWIRPDIEEMIEAVDWTTLVFFMSLFIVVGAIQEVGLIGMIATGIGNLVGENLILTMLVVTWFSAVLSTVVANIPFTAAMLPVVGYLSATVPGAHSKVLFYCLSVGSAMGGNGSLIGASANMVTAGISERAGHPITYVYFLRKGFPALVLTVALATIWLLLRFVVLV
ncbi:MAG: SLC13 family permease [Anaerolineae bacterium]|jgi:Na+/H+ antiporter NhaD/arsenite permease-like protein